ncbi:amidase [Acidisphaera sp. L21]|uniref:amidase n=1 Tax=Acidisphaera sp. L21 TaxID=1641851 RepID=UPI00131ABF9E|nr:amidase [Acidisphaera sp. L21]
MTDDGFLPGPRCQVAGATTGPLEGLSFAVKDLIDVAGYPTLGGTPDWATGRPVPQHHAWIVDRLLQSGASIVGKTVTDEVSLGILGENVHDGTPLNPKAPDRVPGGSSSGSASAVAAGLCDFALGTDSGGSVRVPSSFCGLFGIRPTLGRIDFTGITVQSPSSDTVGWFARDGTLFARIGASVFDAPMPAALPTRLLIATDAFGFADAAVQEALRPMVDRLAVLVGEPEPVLLAPQGLSVWQQAQRLLQSSESWATFAPWLDRANPRLAWSVARALAMGSLITDTERNRSALMREEARARMAYLLPPGTILCLPTTPFPAPLRGQAVSALAYPRDRISCLTSHGGLTGVPQVNLPGAHVDGAPVGLSIVAGRGCDMDLLAVARRWTL